MITDRKAFVEGSCSALGLGLRVRPKNSANSALKHAASQPLLCKQHLHNVNPFSFLLKISIVFHSLPSLGAKSRANFGVALIFSRRKSEIM